VIILCCWYCHDFLDLRITSKANSLQYIYPSFSCSLASVDDVDRTAVRIQWPTMFSQQSDIRTTDIRLSVADANVAAFTAINGLARRPSGMLRVTNRRQVHSSSSLGRRSNWLFRAMIWFRSGRFSFNVDCR